jgi:fructose/tagatose bisphosphate aldolase
LPRLVLPGVCCPACVARIRRAGGGRSPISIHLDHLESAALIVEAIELGPGLGIGATMTDPRRYLAPARDRVSELVAHLGEVIAAA